MATFENELLSRAGADPDAVAAPEAREDHLVFMIFRVGALWYGVGATHVRRVVSLTEAVPVPGTPLFVRGIVNVAGQLVTLFDLALLLGVGAGGEAGDQIAERCLLIETGNAVVALGVNEVSGLADVKKSALQAPRSSAPNDPAQETFDHSEHVVTVLHVGRLIELAESKVKGTSPWRS